jgi:FemAB family protein
MIEGKLNQIAGSIGLSIRGRLENRELWEEMLGLASFIPVAYLNSSLDYQMAYQRGHGGDWIDISSIILLDNKATALWPLSFSIKDGLPALSSHGLPVLPPIFVSDCSPVSRKRIIKKCLDLANEIAMHANIQAWVSGESFHDSMGMTDWHIESMKRGAVCNVYHDMYLDLRGELIDIRCGFRKSTKSEISAGYRLWDISVMDSANESVWREFRGIHFKSSGRVTRSDETWTKQLEDIGRRNSFLITLRRNGSGELIGGSLICTSHDEGYYAVGAYDRSLFGNSLAHAAQYEAIMELKRRGVLWYKLGARYFPNEVPAPTEKQLSISQFKQGFCSHFFPHYHLKHKI